MNTNKNSFTINKPIRAIDSTLAVILIIILLPLWIFNALRSVMLREPLYFYRSAIDALGRSVLIPVFTRGAFSESLTLLLILRGHLQFCGASLHYQVDPEYRADLSHIAPGLFSLFDMYQWTGLIDRAHNEVLASQAQNKSPIRYSICLARIFLTYMLYAKTHLSTNKVFSIFGVRINNYTLQEALSWVFAQREDGECQLGFFVNVHSINIANSNPTFKADLHKAQCVLADGSGVRLAASHAGERLLSNLNGTDLLPHICRKACEQNKSIYLLGSAPGVAQLAAENLQKTFGGLKIAGFHHGYFKPAENQSIVNNINASGADICFVAMGSPLQEKWLIEHAAQLNCSTALAVGGLLDFYSGKIPRAPSWMREIGFEWVWRLIQEPSAKFNRYVIGNPVFLFRTFVMNQARG